ncbi:MAG: hypothetical protein ACAI35_19060 [Candidatus Methylacidiphilales bacterium]
MKIALRCLLTVLLVAGALSRGWSAKPAEVKEITQYGVTWTFEKPCLAGQFITGDWWVAGPVTVVTVSPKPQPAPADEPITDGKSIYGATALVDDRRLRNGSMAFTAGDTPVSFSGQGYDSRIQNYDPALTVTYPLSLTPGQSLISSISSEVYRKGKLATPFVPSQQVPELVKGLGGAEMVLALDTAAILTCLDKAPPADSFRPAYIGRTKTLYLKKDIRWDLLPALKPVAATPDWKAMSRVFERPWLDHDAGWTIQFTGPGQNQPNYGGVFSHMTTAAGLMLLLDVPKEQKEKLMIGYLQLGIDLHGLAHRGRNWFSDGGHWMGRKWPIFFAATMLNSEELRTLPVVNLETYRVHKSRKMLPTEGIPAPTTIFQEDLDTYYGEKGAGGQTVFWQVVFHTRPREAFMEKPYSQWNEDDKFCSKYYWTVGNWNGFALAALYMKQKAAWNHDAFFDFCDWTMVPGQKTPNHKGVDSPCRNGTAQFVQQMWDAYREGAPAQPGGRDNLRWVWTNGKWSDDGQKFQASEGRIIQNPKPTAASN